MGQEAKHKAARKAKRQRALTAPKYIATGHLEPAQRRKLQQERDQALSQLRRQYEAAQENVRTAYWQKVTAADNPQA